MATITLNQLSKSYESTEVLHHIEGTIDDGSLVVIVGPSGCGKSTLLRMIAGLETVTSGEITIGGNVVNKLEPADRDIAMVFQNYALYPHMSVRKNMAYSLKIRKIPLDEINRRVEDAAKILELTPFLERKPQQLSGGQRQRVAMGRAIVRDPQVFLFDEPLSNLDAKLRVQMRLEIRKLQKRLGVTSIYVTHDRVEAMTLGDRLMVLNAGRVEQYDTPIALYERPASMFVAGFIGSPSMNFIVANSQDGLLTLENEATLTGSKSNSGAVIVGIRPEHLVQRVDGPLAVRIEVLEHLGANTLVHGVLEGTKTPIVVSIDGLQTLATDEVICFAPLEGQIHLFNPETEARLTV